MLKVLKRLPQTHSFQFIIILKGWWRRLEAHTRDINTTPRHATATTTHISQKDSSDCLISTINEITPALLILNMLTSTASAPAADVTTCPASAQPPGCRGCCSTRLQHCRLRPRRHRPAPAAAALQPAAVANSVVTQIQKINPELKIT